MKTNDGGGSDVQRKVTDRPKTLNLEPPKKHDKGNENKKVGSFSGINKKVTDKPDTPSSGSSNNHVRDKNKNVCAVGKIKTKETDKLKD